MAAVLADGTTVIDNVAREPEIVDLCEMLVAMGAKIEGIAHLDADRRTASSQLAPVEHATVTDRIVAGTWAFAAAIAGGDLTVRGAAVPSTSTSCWTSWSRRAPTSSDVDGGFRVRVERRLDVLRRGDAALPGVPDRPAAVRDGAGRGQRRHRDDHRERLRGAVHVRPGAGPARRRPAHRRPPRGGARQAGALRCPGGGPRHPGRAPRWCSPGWPPQGTTTVAESQHIDRGYPYFVETLAGLGVDIERVDVPDLDD